MFAKLYNEAVISFQLKTASPLFIKSGAEEGLNPTAVDNSYLAMYKDGIYVPVLPGTSLKGVFRCRAEKILKGSCNIFSNRNCGVGTKELNGAKEKYKGSCPACRLFGSTSLKSRVYFNDAFPEGEYKTGKRHSVAIDRISGASKALFELEYVESATFKCQVKLVNFFNWQLKTLMQILKDIDEGYVTFGGLTSKGFGRMNVANIEIRIRYYDKTKTNSNYAINGIYFEREISGMDAIWTLLDGIKLDNKLTIERCEFNEQAI